MFQTTTSIPKLNYSVALKRDNAMMERDTLSVNQPSPANPRWLHFDPSIRIVFGTPGQADSGRIF